MAQLSRRLATLLENLKPGEAVWDVCCDHGLLGRAALARGFAPVNFVDCVPHITQKLEDDLGGDARARVFCVDGAQLRVPVEGSLVIAGVGGEKIQNILEGLQASANLRASRLVLGPHKDESDLWAWMENQKDWRKIEWLKVEEGPRFREIAVFDRA